MQRADYKPGSDIQDWLKQQAAAGDEKAKELAAKLASKN